MSSWGLGVRRSRAAAGLLLLALTAHAFVASATHYHRLAPPGALAAQAAVHGSEERGQDAPLAGDEKQCLLCRLQRNLVADLQPATVVLAPPPAQTPQPEHFRQVVARPGAALLRKGRAPPSLQS